MKGITKVFILFAMIFTITGCSSNGSNHNTVGSGNSVDKIINDQMTFADPESREAETADSEPEEMRSIEKLAESSELPGETVTQTADGVDYDLSAMSGDMVYAMVYQMMTDPYTYVGKTFRMSGLYASVYQESTAHHYHYCIIQDALACCAQGMEFLCDDGIHISPEDYPKENTEIVVQGIFETYQEEGDSNLYCRLKDAVLEVKDN